MLSAAFMTIYLATAVGCCACRAFPAPTDGVFLYNIGLLSVRELNSNREKYHGKTVYVIGHLLITPQSHNLYQSREEDELGDQAYKSYDRSISNFDFTNTQKNCFAIVNPYGLWKRFAELKEATVIIKGEYVADFYLKGDQIDFGSCSITTGPAFIMDYDDFERRYPSVFAGKRRPRPR